MSRALRSRQRLGKYRIERQLAEGGFATVYRAMDTVEGVRVALKVPRAELVKGRESQFTHEVRLASRLDHPNVLPVKNAQEIDGYFVIAYPLGDKTLGDRMASRMSARRALGYFEQALLALAHAHERRVMHLDIKPENFILFGTDRVRLTDFGISKIALSTRTLSGSGTIGYIAPEQALGRPSLRSDVFALGLMGYKLFTGCLPVWPFKWPPPGIARLRATVHPDLAELLRRCIEVDEAKRPSDATRVLAAYQRIRSRALKPGVKRKPSAKRKPSSSKTETAWKQVRVREFLRRHGGALGTRGHCGACGGPTTEAMSFCPWCGERAAVYTGPTRLSHRCERCGRGRKSDWRFCNHCWGKGVGEVSLRRYADRRYERDCEGCGGGLMPFSRYCQWCHQKVTEPWPIAGAAACSGCGWGLLADFWEHCAWCGRRAR